MGFDAAGLRTVGAVEVDHDAAAAFTRNVGLAPVVKDIRDVRGCDLLDAAGLERGELTLLFGCPPCQSFTILRRGMEPTQQDLRRNGLIYEYLRLVEELFPRHIAFENVPGLVDGRWREYFDSFREVLTELGFAMLWKVIDAAEYGVPQRRRRVLVLGSRVTEPLLPRATHAEDGAGGLTPYVTVRDTIAGLPMLAAGQKDPRDEFHRARRHSPLALQRLAALDRGGRRGA
jgi:DNA (cytosine-5)-methyltransferase 1